MDKRGLIKSEILDLDKIRNNTNQLFKKMNKAINISKNSTEEKLKTEVLSVFRDFFIENSIDFSSFIQYEESKIGTLKVNGRTDALYGTLIMEFKSYGKLDTEKELKKAIKQTKK